MRNQPLTELNALRTGAQPTMPQFQPYQGANVAPAPVFNAAQQQGAWDQNAYNQQVGQQNATTSGLFGLGSAAAMSYPWYMAAAASDRRLKRKIKRIGTHASGVGLYKYDIFDRHETGVMADEVERVLPEAVVEHPSGYKMVRYGLLHSRSSYRLH